MYMPKKLIFDFAIGFICTLEAIGKDGYCSKNTDVNTTNGTDTVKKNYCCSHFERQNNECKECKVGYTTQNGKPCHQCDVGLYGKRCAFICNCRISERCHHIVGCLNIEQKFTEQIAESTLPVKDISLSTDFDDSWPTTRLYPSIKPLTFRKISSTDMISSKGITSTTKKPASHDLGLNIRDVIVYFTCAALFLFVVLLCIGCQRRYKHLHNTLRRYQTEGRRSRTIADTIHPDIQLQEIEAIYEVVEESNVINDIENARDISSSVTDTSGSYCQPDNNDYLTPYHQEQEQDSNTNNSWDDRSESSVTSSLDRKNTGDHISTSLNSDVQGRRSSFLNSHPVDIDVHEYVFAYSSNESCLSSPEVQTRESDYLNPYQPMIPDNDLHEYKCLQGSANGLGSLSYTRSSKHMGVIVSKPDQDFNSDTDINEHR